MSPLGTSPSSGRLAPRPTAAPVRIAAALAAILSLTARPPALAAQAATPPPPVPANSNSDTAPLAQSVTAKYSTSSTAAKPPAKLALTTAPPGFDTAAASKDILAHLSAVIRFYRLSLTPIQKVGEPSDLLYFEQASTYSSQVASYAFQSARAEASLIEQIQKLQGSSPTGGAETDAQRVQTARNTVTQQLAALKDQEVALTRAIATARPKNRPALEQQQERVQGAIELQSQMADALGKIASLADAQSHSGLPGDIDRLQRSAPELADTKPKIIAPPLENLTSTTNAGVSSQASALFRLLATRRSIDLWIGQSDALQKQALDLRTPLVHILRSTLQQGQALAQAAAAAPPVNVNPSPAISAPVGSAPTPSATAASTASPPIVPPVSILTDAQTLAATRKQFDSLTASFKALSAAAVPLSQEMVTLQQNRANLIAWRAAVNTEYHTVLRDLLLRVLAIALALGVIFALGEVWRRATNRYVHDIRRRRQLLVLRRLVVGFLSGIVLIFGLVTQFNSLATFAGFITAGLAVGLQTILLSVAAYFFIIGRFGVRVGDRITVAGVTGDVIDVGLVRFYILELAGGAIDLHPTGRVAVFSNAVLFQAGTPLFKQMPGTEYAWHELTVKLSLTSDYRKAAAALLSTIQAIYETYRPRIERQHSDMESWIDSSVDAPKIESHLQLIDDGLQFWVRFPVEIRNAAATDQQVTDSVLKLMSTDDQLKSAITAPPAIKGVVKG